MNLHSIQPYRWPIAFVAAVFVLAVINPELAVVFIVGAVTAALYLTWRRTQLRRTGWPRPASIAFSVVTLGLAGLFGLTTAYGALSTAGVIEPSPETASAPTTTVTPAPLAAEIATEAPTPTPELGSVPTGSTVVARVVDVIDGDTIRVEIDGETFTVRYIGMDTPETVHPTEPVEWMGLEASAANSRLVDGAMVVLEKDISETDRFDRILRYVWLETDDGWLLVNLELVRLGYATPSTYTPDVKYQELIRAAGLEAREAEVGLWASTPAPSPTASPSPTATPSPTAVPTAAPTLVPVPTIRAPAPTIAPVPVPTIVAPDPLPPAPVPIVPPPPPPPAPACHASYSNVCLGVGIGDYDCSSGSGNGPNYVVGPVYVVGYDEFGLDSDGDGVGCESG